MKPFLEKNPAGANEATPRAAWFPGHMLKAERQMREALSLVDLVVQLVDARAPLSSRNPKLLEWLQQRPHIVVANKADLSSPQLNRAWRAWFEAQGEPVEFLQAAHLKSAAELTAGWKAVIEASRQARGVTRPMLRPYRLMIVGIPNIGKSTLINRLKSRNVAKMGPKPGVTRQTQWVPIAGGMELLDTPGVLWPQLRDRDQEMLLTLLGNIPDEAGDPVRTASNLVTRVQALGIREPWKALDLPGEPPEEPEALLEALARRRGMLLPGSVPSLSNAAHGLLKDFRLGRLGRWTFEHPPQAAKADGEA